MEQYNRALRNLLKVLNESIEVDTLSGGVEVFVLFELETGISGDIVMVWPSGGWHVHYSCRGKELLQEF